MMGAKYADKRCRATGSFRMVQYSFRYDILGIKATDL